MEADGEKSHDEPGVDASTFFRRYKPAELPEQEAGGSFFTKYVPAETPCVAENSKLTEVGLEAEPEQSALMLRPQPAANISARFRPQAVFVVVGFIALSITLGILYRGLRPGASPGVNNPAPVGSTMSAGVSENSEESDKDEPGDPEVSIKRGGPTAKPKHPNLPTAVPLSSLLAQAREFQERGMVEQAEQAYRDILRVYPDDPLSRSALDRIERTRATQQRDERARASRESGLTKFRRGDYGGAESDLAYAVSAGRTDTATLYALGMSYLKLRNYSQALSVLSECIEASPDYAPALVGLAQVKLSAGDKKEALSLLNRALELGGGAEFSPVKIRDMMASISSKPQVPSKPSRGFFFAYAVHRHSSSLTWCRGALTVSNSVIEFKADKPSHSFQISSANTVPVSLSQNELSLSANGKEYRLTLEGKTVRQFMAALGLAPTE